MKKTVKMIVILGVMVFWVGLVLGQNSAPEGSQLSPADAKAKIIKVLASNAKKRIATPYILEIYMDMKDEKNPPSKVIPEMLQGLSQSKYVDQNKVTLRLFTNAKREDALNFLAEIMVANSIDPEPILAKLNFHAVFSYKGWMYGGLETLSIPEQRRMISGWVTSESYSWAQFDQFIEEKVQEPGQPESYLDVRGLVELGVVGGFLQYDIEKLDEISQNNGEPLPIETEYVVWYYFDTDLQDCPLCQTELEGLIEAFFYDSKLAKDGKVSLILFSQNSQHNTFQFLVTAITSVFCRRGGFARGAMPSSEEMAALLHRVHFFYSSEVKFSDLGIDEEKIKKIPESKIFPILNIFGPPIDGDFKNRKSIYLVSAEKVIWSKIDQIILAKTPKK